MSKLSPSRFERDVAALAFDSLDAYEAWREEQEAIALENYDEPICDDDGAYAYSREALDYLAWVERARGAR